MQCLITKNTYPLFYATHRIKVLAALPQVLQAACTDDPLYVVRCQVVAAMQKEKREDYAGIDDTPNIVMVVAAMQSGRTGSVALI